MSTLKTKLILLKELLALKEIVDSGSIQVASDANGIKTSNMSQLIKDLESRFNTHLINRDHEGSHPTNSTQLIYNDITNIEKILNNIVHQFINTDELSGSISIWTEEGLIGSFILRDLSDFYAQYPKIRLELLMRQEPDISNTDILIIDTTTHQNVRGKILFKFRVTTKFYASAKYLNTHGTPKSINDLLTNFDLNIAQRYLDLPEFQFIIKQAKHLNTTSDSLALIYRLVNDGDGITLLPSWFEKYSKNLVAIDNLNFHYENEAHCICRTEISEYPKIQAFAKFFIDFCTKNSVPIDIIY